MSTVATAGRRLPAGGRAGAAVVAGAVIAFALPYVVLSGPARLLAITALIYVLLVTSWTVTIGAAGVFNFAHLAFFGAGGYAMAVATVTYGIPPWPALALAALVGGLAGPLAYLPVVRMRGIYVALVTFVFVQLCYYLVLAVPGVTGGSDGLTGVPSLEVGGVPLSRYNGLGYLWLLGALVVLALVGLYLLLRTPLGLSWLALRDNERLAAARGIPRVRQTALAFAVSGAVAGLTGGLYVSVFRVADVTLFSFSFVTLGLSMIFLGGVRHAWGPAVGAVLVTVVDQRLTDLGAWRTIVLGLGTVAVLVLLPDGVAGLLVRSARSLQRPARSPSPAAGHQSEGSSHG